MARAGQAPQGKGDGRQGLPRGPTARTGPCCPAHLPDLCLAEEPAFRCDECDELFQCKLDLRRHKKYACGSARATLYEDLGDGLKPEGLGGSGSDGQAHECKDCERMFPNKYRCAPPLALVPPRSRAWSQGAEEMGHRPATLVALGAGQA